LLAQASSTDDLCRPSRLQHHRGRRELRDLAERNGRGLDGTPIIKTPSEVDDLTDEGFVTQTKRPSSEVGRYFICPGW